MSKKRVLMMTLSVLVCLTLNLSVFSCPTIVTNKASGGQSSVVSDTPYPDDIFCFIAYGDTRSNSPGNVSPIHEQLVGLYLEHDPELILNVGDLVYHGGEWYQYADFNESIQLVWEYDIPYFIAAGNHEMYTDDWVNDPSFTNYTAFVDYSDVAAACGGTELYYSFDANGTHFTFLNTETDWNWDTGDYTCSADQMAWLTEDLAATGKDDFIVVVFHRPYFGSSDSLSKASIRDDFHALFVEHGVDLVFNGHEHLYYRTIQDGIHYVVTGGGGAPLVVNLPQEPVWNEDDVYFSDYHYCVAKYESGYLNVEVFLLNGTLRDSFSLSMPQESTISTTVTTTTTTTSSGTNYTITYLAIGVCAVAIVLIVIYLGSKRK
jgi:hypothetical protein